MWLTVFSLMVEHTSRRKTLEIAGSVATVTFLAGCSSDSEPSDGDDGSTDDGSTDDGSTDDGSTDDGSTDDGSTDDGSTDDGSTDDGSTDDGSSGDDSNTVDPAEWEDVSTIHLESDGVNWKGVAPEMIADAQNPTIVLFEGNEYEFIYENGDGGRHNLELWNEEQSVVNGYSTELMREQGEQLSFTAEATPEIANYVCNPHSATMIGEVRIE